MILNDQAILLLVGAGISILSVVAGGVLPFLLNSARYNRQLKTQDPKPLEKERLQIDRELLVELKRLSAQLSNEQAARQRNPVAPVDRAPAYNPAASAQRENTWTVQEPPSVAADEIANLQTCPNCKKQNPQDGQFCIFCGTPLGNPQGDRQNQPT